MNAGTTARADKGLCRAKMFLSMLEDGYSIFDVQNPTEEMRTEYANRCGEIWSLIEVVKECVDAIA